MVSPRGPVGLRVSLWGVRAMVAVHAEMAADPGPEARGAPEVAQASHRPEVAAHSSFAVFNKDLCDMRKDIRDVETLGTAELKISYMSDINSL